MKAPPNRRRIGIGYVRVSTDQQVRTGMSLDQQREAIRAWCKAHDVELREVFADEGISAKNMQRPALQDALRALRAADCLIVFRLDRLTRNLKSLVELLDGDLMDRELVSISDPIDRRTPGGRLVLHVLGAAAQMERELISARVTEAYAHARRNGLSMGHVPFGYQRAAGAGAGVRARLVPDPDEWPIVQEIVRLRREGRTFRAIVKALVESGSKPRKRGKWHPFTVKKIVDFQVRIEALEEAFIPEGE